MLESKFYIFRVVVDFFVAYIVFPIFLAVIIYNALMMMRAIQNIDHTLIKIQEKL